MSRLRKLASAVALSAALVFPSSEALAAKTAKAQPVKKSSSERRVDLSAQLDPARAVQNLPVSSQRKRDLFGILAQESAFNPYRIGNPRVGDAGVAQLTPIWLGTHHAQTGQLVNPFNAQETITALNGKLDEHEKQIRKELEGIPRWEKVLKGWSFSEGQIRLAAIGAHNMGPPFERVMKKGKPHYFFSPDKVLDLANSDYVKNVLRRGVYVQKGLFQRTIVPKSLVEKRIQKAIKFLAKTKHGFYVKHRGEWIAQLKSHLGELNKQPFVVVFGSKFELARGAKQARKAKRAERFAMVK
ncbi:MAG TPA: hypothetical protein VGQ00_03035 [Candidatus Norongarragalinales archaeon]|jgi:hypothetical protein|nr:hypothetical protein [Candidatus Norongarragalinales archaeon]